MPSRLDIVTIVASDFPRSLAIYDAALTAAGFVRTIDLGDEEEEDAAVEAAGWGPAGGSAAIWLVVGEVATTGVHVGLRADDAATVREFYGAAIDAGATGRSAPRRWPIFRRGEFNAVVADPDGNLIEVVGPEV